MFVSQVKHTITHVVGGQKIESTLGLSLNDEGIDTPEPTTCATRANFESLISVQRLWAASYFFSANVWRAPVPVTITRPL